jgi:hypothetical protein
VCIQLAYHLQQSTDDDLVFGIDDQVIHQIPKFVSGRSCPKLFKRIWKVDLVHEEAVFGLVVEVLELIMVLTWTARGRHQRNGLHDQSWEEHQAIALL